MPTDRLDQWLAKLGYTAEAQALHQSADSVPPSHPYALEMRALLRPTGSIRAQAVYDVEGVPTVVFLEATGQPHSQQDLDALRQRLWNQNLVSVVIAVEGNTARAMPVRHLAGAEEVLSLDQARQDGPFSAAEVWSSALAQRLPSWFDTKARVDRKLLQNLGEAVRRLREQGLGRELAQVLMGQILFVSYLEHRGIISPYYRDQREVGVLHDLVASGDRAGVLQLVGSLREDFNGDFLAHGNPNAPQWDPLGDALEPWRALPDAGFALLNDFLDRVDLRTRQGSFWKYDFSFIPVELLSGLYESFLSATEQQEHGAYYTPRHLATLAVDQAFLASPDPLAEQIFDGACGSGILLTTAYRKLIALSEARNGGERLGFVGRRQLLLDRIFGGDINPMACRVTAFSLYLSLLEGLDPADVLKAQMVEGVKLPSLRGSNLAAGASADIFSDEHPFFGRRFTLILSNPAWKEASGDLTSADHWARRAQAPFVRRQLAGAYSLRALDFLVEGGRLCLILPIAQFLGTTSGQFVEHLFRLVRPRRLINFGDLQQLLFASADNTCHVLVATRRTQADVGRVHLAETFDYCVPKADVSLSFGRLSLHSADRHDLQTQAIQRDPQQLVLLMWGDARDRALLARLQLMGTMREMFEGKLARWVNRKGIHPIDASREPQDPGALREMKMIPLQALKRGVPVVHSSELIEWPTEVTTVVGLNEHVMRVFDGPRVVFPDGFAKMELNVRASFVDGPASFFHGVGVIAGPREDEALLRFTAVYLRSSLARYFLMLTGAKMLTERNGVHLTDIKPFPFFSPEYAPDPQTAERALKEVAAFTRYIERRAGMEQLAAYEAGRGRLDELVFAYFGLSEVEKTLVRESVDVLLPSVRPRSYKSLYTRRQRPATGEDLQTYAQALGAALDHWRDAMQGAGRFEVSVASDAPGWNGSIGVVRVRCMQGAALRAQVDTRIDDALAREVFAAIRRESLDRVDAGGMLCLLDQRVWTGGALYLARSLTRRAWLTRTALRDAEQIVRDVHGTAPSEQAAA